MEALPEKYVLRLLLTITSPAKSCLEWCNNLSGFLVYSSSQPLPYLQSNVT